MACGCCDSQKFVQYWNGFVKCKSCAVVRQQHLPSQDDLRALYEDDFYAGERSERFGRLAENFICYIRKKRADKVESFAVRKGKILDVGFGRGIMLKMLKDRGWQCYGTQVSRKAYLYAKKELGLNVFLGELQQARYPSNFFDAVTYWHVLEHVIKPAEYVAETARILKPRGKLIIEIPNIGSPIAKFFREKWFSLCQPYHIYNFSPHSLRQLLSSKGFDVVREEYFSLEQSPFSLLQSTLNVITNERNGFFNTLKLGKSQSLFKRAYYTSLAAFFAPLAFISALGFSAAGKGDIMRFYAVKR